MASERACCVARRGGPWAALLSGLALALAPKCPVCIAAYLSVLGASIATAAAFVPLLRPVGVLVVATALLALVRRRRALG
jgi:hypothetical protein